MQVDMLLQAMHLEEQLEHLKPGQDLPICTADPVSSSCY